MARRGGGGGRRSKVTPNLAADREGTRMLNLTVLRRLDPAVADILITAASVTAYSFDQDTVRWSRKGVEGSLFVVKRNTQPRFQFLIMNRRNTENLVEDLLGGFDYKVEVPYIIYTNAAAEIIGIWFYEPEECEEVAHLFSRIRKAYSRASPEKMVPSVKSFSDFEELEVASDVPSSEEDSLEQPTTSSSMVPGSVGYKLLSALLTAAACVGAPTGGAGPVQPNQPIRAVPPSRRASPAPSAVSSQPPASHNLLPPSRASSATVVPPDAHVPTSAPTIQPASLTKPPFFPPIPTTSSQATTAHAAFPSSAPPPFLPPLAIQHRQSAPFFQPFPLPSAPPPPLDPPHRQSAPLSQPFAQSTAPPPLDPQHRQSAPLAQPFTQSTAPPAPDPQKRQNAPMLEPFQLSSAPSPPRPQHWQRSSSLEHFARPAECPPPPYGALLLQPFPPPNPPPPLLAPAASYGPEILSKDKLRGALLRLVQNDDFIDMLYREIVKG